VNLCGSRMKRMSSGLRIVQTRQLSTSNLSPVARLLLFGEWLRFVRYGCWCSRPFLTPVPTTCVIAVITGNVISRIYPVHPPSHSMKRAALAELGAQLDQWYAELPDSLAFDPASSRSIPPPNVLLMHATYWNAVLLLHRAL
jgi:hypothetical protein